MRNTLVAWNRNLSIDPVCSFCPQLHTFIVAFVTELGWVWRAGWARRSASDIRCACPVFLRCRSIFSAKSEKITARGKSCRYTDLLLPCPARSPRHQHICQGKMGFRRGFSFPARECRKENRPWPLLSVPRSALVRRVLLHDRRSRVVPGH